MFNSFFWAYDLKLYLALIALGWALGAGSILGLMYWYVKDDM